ncbi:hypothetical protein LPJGGPFB_05103 [Ensifer adhaerens]|uniref:hypothetical protein n=1 Tax=Ensifer adhaerens TaxID=106592 RepID=UPI0015699D6D|nr:hypothetical protein [Ensifer adhaerens]NRP21844.1 hypothetical protein [Ensifer adhaerens]
MQHIGTTVTRQAGLATVRFTGEGGEYVDVALRDDARPCDDEKMIERAKAAMVHLTAFGTRDGGGSLNAYDALSNGNLDAGEPLICEPSPPPAGSEEPRG